MCFYAIKSSTTMKFSAMLSLHNKGLLIALKDTLHYIYTVDFSLLTLACLFLFA